MVAWPATVPTDVLSGSYTEEPEDYTASFTPEVGPTKDRPRSSVATARLAWQQALTGAEVAALDAFYRTDLKGGVLTFTRTHPRKGTTATLKFVERPRYSEADGIDDWRVSITVQEQP